MDDSNNRSSINDSAVYFSADGYVCAAMRAKLVNFRFFETMFADDTLGSRERPYRVDWDSEAFRMILDYVRDFDDSHHPRWLDVGMILNREYVAMTPFDIDVGGVVYETFCETLTRIPYFSGTLKFGGLPTFVDRDGERFKHVLRMARIDGWYYDCIADLRSDNGIASDTLVKKELEYFGYTEEDYSTVHVVSNGKTEGKSIGGLLMLNTRTGIVVGFGKTSALDISLNGVKLTRLPEWDIESRSVEVKDGCAVIQIDPYEDCLVAAQYMTADYRHRHPNLNDIEHIQLLCDGFEFETITSDVIRYWFMKNKSDFDMYAKYRRAKQLFIPLCFSTMRLGTYLGGRIQLQVKFTAKAMNATDKVSFTVRRAYLSEADTDILKKSTNWCPWKSLVVTKLTCGIGEFSTKVASVQRADLFIVKLISDIPQPLRKLSFVMHGIVAREMDCLSSNIFAAENGFDVERLCGQLESKYYSYYFLPMSWEPFAASISGTVPNTDDEWLIIDLMIDDVDVIVLQQKVNMVMSAHGAHVLRYTDTNGRN